MPGPTLPNATGPAAAAPLRIPFWDKQPKTWDAIVITAPPPVGKVTLPGVGSVEVDTEQRLDVNKPKARRSARATPAMLVTGSIGGRAVPPGTVANITTPIVGVVAVGSGKVQAT